MQRRTVLVGLLAQSLIPLPAWARKLKPYSGPEITRLVLYKKRRRLFLLHGAKSIKEYRVGLGSTSLGPKQFEGDGKTPEGSYIVDRRNPNSSFHLSIGISYPNNEDRAFAAAAERNPGGDIFIHGRSGEHKGRGKDWTAGCIAVKDRQMEEIYMMVPLGVQIDIYP